LTVTDLEREEIKISHVAKFICPTSQLLKRPARSAFRHLILTTPLCEHLLLTMSTIPTSIELNDSECEKGQVTQQPPIPYAASKAGLLMMTTRGTVNMKMPEGEHKQAILGNGVDREEYVKHLMAFDCILEKKGYASDLVDAAKAVLKVSLTLNKHSKVPKGEEDPDKALRLTEVKKAAERELTTAKVVESTVTCLAYDLFRKLTKDDLEIQRDRIVADMHTNGVLNTTGSTRNRINLESIFDRLHRTA
jgi:hypothetical protein